MFVPQVVTQARSSSGLCDGDAGRAALCLIISLCYRRRMSERSSVDTDGAGVHGRDESALRAELERLIQTAREVSQRHKSATHLNRSLTFLESAARCLDSDGFAEAGAIDWRVFSSTLKARRKSSGLAQKELADKARMSLSHIRAVENGQRRPSGPVLLRLLNVAQLGLKWEDLATRPAGVTPSLWLAPQYDPRAMLGDLCDRLNGSGCSLEQTFAYLDPQSSCDWLALSNEPHYIRAFENMAPMEEVARKIAASLDGRQIDIIAIGSGEAKRECLLFECLRRLCSRRTQIRLLLLDISHTLLTTGYLHARSTLGKDANIVALHGNFHELSQYPLFGDADRARVFTMFGCTLQNLDNEIRFFRDNLAAAAPGDFFVCEYSTAYSAPEDTETIKATDPALVHGVQESHRRWLSGPIRRYVRDLISVDIGVEFEPDCVVRGSYELPTVATVRVPGAVRRFVCLRVRRYDSRLLETALQRTGWSVEANLAYGSTTQSRLQLLLLTRGG